MALHSALNRVRGGMTPVFLQDADTLIVKPVDLVRILEYLRLKFPRIERITSCGRSHSAARISDEEMSRIAAAGLNGIHIGMETGAAAVLDLGKKGVDKKTHIVGRRAGIFMRLDDLNDPELAGQADRVRTACRVTMGNYNAFTAELVKRFI